MGSPPRPPASAIKNWAKPLTNTVKYEDSGLPGAPDIVKYEGFGGPGAPGAVKYEGSGPPGAPDTVKYEGSGPPGAPVTVTNFDICIMAFLRFRHKNTH